MIIDRYTKIVLTVIALSLGTIAVSTVVPVAYAELSNSSLYGIENRLDKIARAIAMCN